MTSKIKQADILQQVVTTTGTASAYELTIQKLDALVDEQVFFVQFHIENNASATLNINSLGAIAINTSEGNAIGAGDLKTTGRYTLVYDDDTASFIVSEMVDSEVENIIGGSGVVESIVGDFTIGILFNKSGFIYGNWYANNADRIFTVQYSNDGLIWTTMMEGRNPENTSYNQQNIFSLFVPNGMYVKFVLSVGVGYTVDKFISI